jgi:hydrogenase maturation protein HypF
VARPEHAPLTSSSGRLFDAVAAWLLPLDAAERGYSLYEGHAAMLLETACGDVNSRDAVEGMLPNAYRLPIDAGEPHDLDWRPLIAAMVEDFQCGISPVLLAMRFHESLADAVFRMAELHAGLPVVLGGGVFQNRVLTEMIARRFAGHTQPLALPGVIPPNDGGLAAGQLAVALARFSLTKSRE